MLFTSWTFIIFLVIVLAVYYCLSTRAQNIFLLLASYFFYGWWDWRFLGLLVFSSVLDYSCALGIETGRRRSAFLLLSIVGNLSVLGLFKYYDFFVRSAVSLLETLGFHPQVPLLQLILPLGISFYTFQTMSYTIDVYRGKLSAERDFFLMALYVTYFPQLVAGPIERAGHLLGQFRAPRRVDEKKIYTGSLLLLLGFFKKLAIADVVAPEVELVFAQPEGVPWHALFEAVWLFALQIYCDFSGYSDMARGTSRLLGIELMVNFNQPYLSANITEFWRRWHISLSTWLRDYVYIPLGGNRHGTARTYRNLMLTMILGGLWHGANWTFVVWGLLHGVYLAMHKWWMGDRPAGRPEWEDGFTARRVIGMMATFHLVLLTWVFFRASNFGDAMEILGGILTFRGGLSPFALADFMNLAFYSFLVLLVDVPQFIGRDHTAILDWPWPIRGLMMGTFLVLMAVLAGGNETPFIYFQF